ncbi:MAG: hypothetical protein JXR88_02810 [Clostridia bacterium]|nr:hypothetical protein [Clostridia bacterium]
MHRFYSKNERKILEFYKNELDTDYRILPYDLNKAEDLKEYLDLVLMSFMDFRKYWSSANDLIEELDETVERFDPLTWLSLFDEEIRGDEKMIETIEALGKAQTHMSELFSSVESKLRNLLQIIMQHDDKIQEFIWYKSYIYDEDAVDELFEDLLESDSASTLFEAYGTLIAAMNKNFSVKTIVNEEPILLHLELITDALSDEEREILIKYGKTNAEGLITRDILVPNHITLHHLHYVIQKLFGWQNSHLRKFSIEQEDFYNLTENRFDKWSELSGLIFQCYENLVEITEVDYSGYNENNNFKKNYTGPYTVNSERFYEVVQGVITEILKQNPMLEVMESFQEFYNRTKNLIKKEHLKPKILKATPLLDATLDEVRQSTEFNIFDQLLEHLPINKVLGTKESLLKDFYDLNQMQENCKGPLTRTLWYQYDFGDNWQVKITRPMMDDVLENIPKDEMNKAIHFVGSNQVPVCLQASGLKVMDDVSGIVGYVKFLETLYLSENDEEKEEMLAWAKDMGWSNRKTGLKQML